MYDLNENEEEEEDVNEFETKHRVFYEEFMHFDEFKKNIDLSRDVIDDYSQTENLYEQFILLFNFYQEQPYLMDAYLRDMIDYCFKAVVDNFEKKKVVHFIYKVVFLLIKTRGHKYIVKLMPHAVSDLVPTLDFLESLESPEQTSNAWQTKFVLLLWLSIIVMIPFDFDTLENNKEQSLLNRLFDLGKVYLIRDEKAQIGASLMLTKLFLRPDVSQEKLDSFIKFSLDEIKINIKNPMTHNKTMGHLKLLCNITKSLPRKSLLHHLSAMLSLKDLLTGEALHNIAIMKFISKLTQRIGLLFCPNKTTWIYKKVYKSLGSNSTTIPIDKDYGVNESVETPDEVAEIIDFLMGLLESSYTVVRWSAAKGIARICSCLSSSMVSDVIEAILALCTPESLHTNWHGACLCLAEMGRRGLLLPEKLPEVIPIVKKALFYEEKMGQYNFGTNVRDSSCYVIWSFARTYSPEDFKPFIDEIASSLVLSMLYDKQVNVRRAAASALQEHVGRQGTFPNGIEIVTTCDFYAVGNISNCYIELTDFVAKYPNYLNKMIDHLMSNLCIGHWDLRVRQLSSEAMKVVTKYAGHTMKGLVLDRMIDSIESGDHHMKQGAILAIKSILSSFDTSEVIMKKDKLIQRIVTLLDYINQGKYFNGNVGASMMSAVCELIHICSKLKLPLKEKYPNLINSWLSFLDTSLMEFDEQVVDSAVVCLPEFLRAYLPNANHCLDISLKEAALGNIRAGISSNTNQIERIGYFKTIGSTSNVLISFDKSISLLNDIINACQITPQTLTWDQSRKAGISALTDYLTLNHEYLSDMEISDAFKTYCLMLNDYSKDARGDIGRNVREAGIASFERAVSYFLNEKRTSVFAEETIHDAFKMIAQISLETIDQTREKSCLTFLRLLHHKPTLAMIPMRDDLLTKIFPDVGLTKKISSSFSIKSFRYFSRLLDMTDYRESAIIGISSTIGGLGVDASTEANQSLLKLFAFHEGDNAYFEEFARSTCQVFQKNLKNIRITKPLFKFIQIILTDARFSRVLNEKRDILTELFELIKKETLNSNQIQMLKSSVELLTSLMAYTTNGFWKTPGARLMVLLGHKFPIIRRTTATYLYETLLIEEFSLDQDKIDQLNEILCDTVWENELTEVRQKRDEICDLFGLDKPKSVSPSTKNP